jgi:nicotinate-nucleotide pyrophosphorylase
VKLSAAEIRVAVKNALSEDLGSGDATTLATVPKNLHATALMRARGKNQFMTTRRTMTAKRPVAAWRFSAETLKERSLTMPTATNHVMSVATRPTPTPTAIGRRFA